MNDPHALIPVGPNEIRQLVLERFAGVFEAQTRNHLFARSITELVDSFHAELMEGLQASSGAIMNLALPAAEKVLAAESISRLASRCKRLETTLALLRSQWHRQHDCAGQGLQEILLEFNRMAHTLDGTLIERDLLERQSRVLETIVLSHEKVTHWKTFVQEILSGFRAVFPFDVFFIAFAEDNELQLHIYYLGHYDDEARYGARTRLAREMIVHLNLPADTPLNIEEFNVKHREAQADSASLEQVRMITVPVPSLDTSNLAGMLGVAYASAEDISPQESSVIHSILAVMVMVVGSSKALGRTLSELEYYSSHDPLTGLYNRRYFNSILEYEIGRSTRHNHEFAILIIDLDDFKDINDTYGHPCGDRVLQQVADTLRACVRQGDLATRIGGDEFAMILVETNAEGGLVVAEKILDELRKFSFEGGDGKRFHVTTSIGMAVFPGDAQTLTDLMAGVDIGLYRAKELGKDGVGTVASVKDRVKRSRDNRDYAEHLRSALAEERVIPYYQAILHCQSGELFAFETLARIIEPNGEIISAGAFIETIEKYGLGRELDRAVIRQALQAVRVRLDQVQRPTRLFINLSAQEIQGRGILGFAEQVCTELEIPPDHIVFEILERDAISDMTHMRKFLTNLRRKGFLFALDDFGSGYNSFHYLRELSFNYVKIDGAFVKNILKSKIDFALVRNLSRLCQDIGILTVAEYVESEEILQALRGMGIDYVQGFYLGTPGPRLSDPPLLRTP
ncbi:MAG: bifunctional diguanylate cyclase/phosphodiesterase [Rhodocyclaceae bacterium]|nr:MAG: bifunctional diguanylate cyclase/phosphodiesterase [Rhodocyclaceae bacterium]